MESEISSALAAVQRNFDMIEEKFKRMDEKFDLLNKRLDELDIQFYKGFNEIDERIQDLSWEIEKVRSKLW